VITDSPLRSYGSDRINAKSTSLRVRFPAVGALQRNDIGQVVDGELVPLSLWYKLFVRDASVPRTLLTRSSAVANRPLGASCHWILEVAPFGRSHTSFYWRFI